MTMRMRAAVLGPFLALLAGCPQNTTAPEPTNIDITVDKTEVVANGTNTVSVTLAHNSDVKLVASRGRFKDQKGGSVTLTGGAGTVELITCDSRESATCAGTVRISANSTAGDATGSTRITFIALENCSNGEDDNGDKVVDCADPGCVGYPCGLPAGSVGEGVCQANGTCLCNGNGGNPEPNEASCGDNRDNDCDGLIDCKDASCENKTCILASGGQGVCVSGECGCPGTEETDPENCSDQIDNDCDGRVDCDDRGCQAKLGEPGVTCDEFGRTCSRASPDGGFGTCSVCPGGETAEVTCGDQTDNDCDGLSDCDDPQCGSVTCGENGRTCTTATARCECSGNGGLVETLERTCGDGADNDCDGKVDCGDEDCQPAGSVPGRACGPNGFLCAGDGNCGCSGNGGEPQDKEVACADGADNDCDGLVDCSETACQPVGNGVGQICNTVGHLVTGIGEPTCSAPVFGPSTCTMCVVPGGLAETAEGVSTSSGTAPTCGDGLDNDCDGPLDCGDPNCTGLPCDVTGKTCTANGQCTCTPSPSGPEQVCTDGQDNDCDGKVDCADTTCDNRACVLGNGAPGRCKAGACGCPGIPEDTDAACSDGVDDDCDGLIDCADSDCQASLAAAGKSCDANGKQCGKPDLAGLATCSVCSRGEPAGEVSCLDGQDNDCDGMKDCADLDCAGRACGNHGVFCNGSTQACECTGNGGSPEASELSCSDGFDNDCDGNKDCRDTDCQPSAAGPGASCGPFGLRCEQSGACTCAGNGGAAEPGDAGETLCSDGVDNDCDGIFDCQEIYCQAVGNQPGKVCNGLGHAASGAGDLTCAAGTVAGGSTCTICTLPDGKQSEYGGVEGQSTVSNGAPTCGDGVDNDCNGPIDCADPNCTGNLCNTTGSRCTASGTCACAKTENAESSCADGVDNDCDGKVDCDDVNCAGLTCVLTGTTVRGVCLGTLGCGCPGEPEDGGTACSDGRDNDCDGRSDCEDSECQTVQVISPTGQYLGVPGQICDEVRGLRCGRGNPDAGGAATCSLCAFNTPLSDGGLSDETSCFDTVDNDCDGLVDCADTTCQPASGTGAGRACRPDGGWACGGGGTCDCFQVDGGAGESKETTCDDGFDNDCDMLVDCVDPDCRPANALSRGADCKQNGEGFGRACSAEGLCTCNPRDGGFEAFESTCSDGADNDCDGLTDCDESACQPVGNNPGPICDRLGHAIGAPIGELTCSSTLNGPSTCSVCTVPSGGRVEATEGITPGPPTTAAITCGDNLDNDCDGRFDCSDINCLGKVCDATGKVCGADGLCGCLGGVAVESNCLDGLDDDCDGQVDCVDPDCQPVGINPGKACGTKGEVCVKGATGGVCQCGGNGGSVEPREASCGDGADNDCDGFSDCSDTDCRSRDTLYPDGGSCDLAISDGPCVGDNDCFPGSERCVAGFCQPMVGYRCNSLNTCVCPGGERAETTCFDGLDNDCDGKVDCADSDCQPAGVNPGRACNSNGMRCSAPAVGSTSGTCSDCRPAELDGGVGEVAETTCYDTIDNDCDGKKDCADTNCQPQPPAIVGAPCKGPNSSQVCVVGGTGGSSGVGGGPPSSQGICLDPALGGNLTLSAAPNTIPSDGVATTTLLAVAKYGPEFSSTPESRVPLANLTCQVVSAGITYTNEGVVFRITAGSGVLIDPADSTRTSTTSLCVGTDSSGVAKVTLRSNSTGTKTTVKSNYEDLVGTYKKLKLESDPVDVAEPKLGTIVEGPYVPLMGVRESGFRESQVIAFKLSDADTKDYPPGLAVTFTHESRGGSYLGEVANCTGTPRVCTATGVTGLSGSATVVLTSGTLAATGYVKATATAGGVTRDVTISNIAFVGAKSNGANISMSCEYRIAKEPKTVADPTTSIMAPPVMRGGLVFDPDMFNGSKTYYRFMNPLSEPPNRLEDFGFTCASFYGDRYGNVIAIPAVTTLASEAGNAASPGPNAPDAGTQKPSVDGWIVNGQAVNVVKVTGYRGPEDVTPRVGETSATYNPGYGARTFNPRDMLGTVIVTVAGEEGFIDGTNGCPADGKYNNAGTLLPDGGAGCQGTRGENFIDIPEPFVDVNDNNKYDQGEYFIDSNSDGVWNQANGKWDTSTTLWTVQRVKYTGDLLFESRNTGITDGAPIMYTEEDGGTQFAKGPGSVPSTTYHVLLMEPDAGIRADGGSAVDTTPQSPGDKSSGSFYAGFYDGFMGAADENTVYNGGFEGSAPVTLSASTSFNAKNPKLGYADSLMFCPVDPSQVTVDESACAPGCTSVNAATGACYMYSSLKLMGYRPVAVSVQAQSGGLGASLLGVQADAELIIRVGDGPYAGSKRVYSASTKDNQKSLAVCVREQPLTICTKRNADCGTVTQVDSCGYTRNVNCGATTCDGNTCCSNQCTDVKTDVKRCGSCTNDCTAGGNNACCNGVCINTNTSPLNCGGCGVACLAGQSCCGGTCKSLNVDPANCGACGYDCNINESKSGCSGGVCQ